MCIILAPSFLLPNYLNSWTDRFILKFLQQIFCIKAGFVSFIFLSFPFLLCSFPCFLPSIPPSFPSFLPSFLPFPSFLHWIRITSMLCPGRQLIKWTQAQPYAPGVLPGHLACLLFPSQSRNCCGPGLTYLSFSIEYTGMHSHRWLHTHTHTLFSLKTSTIFLPLILLHFLFLPFLHPFFFFCLLYFVSVHSELIYSEISSGEPFPTCRM